MLSRRNHVKAVDGDHCDGAEMDNGVVDDGVLIDRTLAGESEAYGVLVARYQNRLYNTVLHLTGSPDEARDVVQDAFVQAFVKLDTFQRAAAFYTWLYRIAFNLRMGRRRRERRRMTLERAKAEDEGDGAGREEGPSTAMESDECVGQVRAAIELLASDHREVLLLREMEGYCYEEISQILDVPVGTVRSRLHRARAQLRQHLQPVYQEHLK